MPLPALTPRLILGTDTTDTDTGHMDTTGHTDIDTMDTAHTDMDTTMERGLLMLSPMPMPLPALTPRLILGTDTTDTDTGHMDIDTMDTAHTDMDTTMERGQLMLSPIPMPLLALTPRLILI